MLRQILWPSLVLKNVRDIFLVIAGFLQSLIKLIIWRPDVVFTKGGYVCLPVGVAAYILNIPLVVHDSDTHPGLTNRILGKWAIKIATGAPLEYYNYPSKKTRYVGIPISQKYHKFSEAERLSAREGWGISHKKPLIVVTGGGLGATRINDTIITVLDKLLKMGSLVLISGDSQYDELRALTPPNNENFQLYPFVSKDFALLLGSADLVIARAGATTILELASLAKPTILIPNAKLTGGHQIKNANVYKNAGAVVVIGEDEMISNPQILIDEIKNILTNPKGADKMAHKFLSFSKPDAASDVADMIISSVK